jgi:DNA-binding NtrC family response regulator
MSDAPDTRTVVFCVENAHDAALSARCLSERDYSLSRTSDFLTARDQVRRAVFDVLLIDARTDPDAALEIAAIARRRDPHVPIFAYVVEVDGDWARLAARAGVTRVLDIARLSCGEIAHVIARCIADAEIANLSALSAELIAMHDRIEGVHRPVPATHTWALETFLAAGGTRAGFRRSWAWMESGPGSRNLH